MFRFSIALLVLCGFLVFSAGPVLADDISDLKEQVKALQETINNQQKTIESLNSKVQAVESKQQAQAVEVKKVPELAKAVDVLKESPKQLVEGLTIGGHLKMFLLDRTDGKRNGVDQSNNLGAGFWGQHNVIFYITKQMEDWLKVEIDPEVDALATATPSVGSDISRDLSTSTTWSLDIYQAHMDALLPGGYELKVGKFNPMFSENYAKELFWHDIMNIKPGLCSLVAYHDFGAELYKNYDFDKWSLPVYFDILTGVYKTAVDNNENKMVMFHVGPEFFQSKLKLLGSLAYGKQDNQGHDDQFFSLVGAEWNYQKVNLLSEYIYKKYKRLVTTGTTEADGKNEGFYIRGKYSFTPKWTGMLQYVNADLYKTGSTQMKSDLYDIETIGLNYNLTPASTILLDYEMGKGRRSDGSERLNWDRVTLGWRTTF